MSPRQRGLLDILWVYLALGALGYLTIEWIEGDPIWRVGVADIVMTFGIFAVSLWKSNSSAYDAYWSIIPSYLTVWLWSEYDGMTWDWLQWSTMLVVNLWSWRLTHNWARGWPGWHHEDWR